MVESKELQGCHVRRLEFCRYLDLVEAGEETVDHPNHAGVRVRVKQIECRRFPERVSAIVGPTFDALSGTFERTHCMGCGSREPHPLQPVTYRRRRGV